MHLPVSNDHGASAKALDSKGVSRKLAVDGSTLTGTTTTSPRMGEKLEKPQKLLPCPRCESMNTKFCYYNNYSVTQPRHFCRQCQRYWTVGGTLRNVPVGGGSRKKNRRGAGEPYLRPAAPTTGPSPLAMATPRLSPTMSFQQFLAHDVPGAFTFSQLPGFVPQSGPFAAYSVDQSQRIQYVTPLSNKQEFTPMYGTHQNMAQPVGGNNYFPDFSAASLQGTDQANAANIGVKPEFWGHMTAPQNAPPQVQASWENVSPAKQSGSAAGEDVGKAGEVAATSVQTGGKSGGYDSSMLLQLGLTSRPPVSGSKGGPGWSQPKNSSSPPHGSSTIEEEGSTPTNGYSNNGYEEGDAVSSMWAQNMHDMQDILCSSL